MADFEAPKDENTLEATRPAEFTVPPAEYPGHHYLLSYYSKGTGGYLDFQDTCWRQSPLQIYGLKRHLI